MAKYKEDADEIVKKRFRSDRKSTISDNDGIIHGWCFDCGRAFVNDELKCSHYTCNSKNVKRTFYKRSNEIKELRS